MANNPHTPPESPKGHDFADDCGGNGWCRFMPAAIRPAGADGRRAGHRHSLEAVAAWVEEQQARWKIVETCTRCKPERPLVAEEVQAHALNHAPDHLRSLARDIAALPDADRRDLLEMFRRPSSAMLRND